MSEHPPLDACCQSSPNIPLTLISIFFMARFHAMPKVSLRLDTVS